MDRKETNMIVNTAMFAIFAMVFAFGTLIFSFKIYFQVAHQNGDLNHDNELTIKDLSILAAQINNK